MDEKDWLLLATLARSKSITRAAESIYISQPAVTKRVKLLENEFQVKILIRSNEGIQLTEAGKYLVQYAEEMIRITEKAKKDVKNIYHKKEPLRIGIPRMFSQMMMPAIMGQFLKAYPNIHAQLRSGFSSEIIQWICSGEEEIAFIRGDYHNSAFFSHPIAMDPICVISRDEVEIDELPNLPRVFYRTDLQLSSLLDSWWKRHFYGCIPTAKLEVGDSQACVYTVKQGAGFAILPLYVVNETDRKDLHIQALLNQNGKPIMRKTSLFYPKGHMTDCARCFVDYVKEMFPSPVCSDICEWRKASEHEEKA